MSTPLPDVSFPNIFDSVWQLVDSTVLFPVKLVPEGESPALMDAPEGEAVPAWVIQSRAGGMLPAGFILRQAPMATLLERLPDGVGIVIEPGSPHGIYIPADQRAALSLLCVPFPHGARVVWGTVPDEARPFADALRARASGLAQLSALWLARFRVEDAHEKLACVYAGDEDQDAATVRALYEVAERMQPPLPVQVVAITDMPGPTRVWLVDEMPPLYMRAPDGREPSDG